MIFCTTAPVAAEFVKRYREKMTGVQFAEFSARLRMGTTFVDLLIINANGELQS